MTRPWESHQAAILESFPGWDPNVWPGKFLYYPLDFVVDLLEAVTFHDSCREGSEVSQGAKVSPTQGARQIKEGGQNGGQNKMAGKPRWKMAKPGGLPVVRAQLRAGVRSQLIQGGRPKEGRQQK